MNSQAYSNFTLGKPHFLITSKKYLDVTWSSFSTACSIKHHCMFRGSDIMESRVKWWNMDYSEFSFIEKGESRATCWFECTLQQQLFKARRLSPSVKVVVFVGADNDWSNTARGKKRKHGCNLYICMTSQLQVRWLKKMGKKKLHQNEKVLYEKFIKI